MWSVEGGEEEWGVRGVRAHVSRDASRRARKMRGNYKKNRQKTKRLLH